VFIFRERKVGEFMSALDRSFKHWSSRKYSHENRHKLYFSKQFLKSRGRYSQRIIKANLAFLKAFPRRFVPSLDFSFFTGIALKSVARYSKNLKTSLKEIEDYLKGSKPEYSNMKSKYHRVKKILPRRVRNRNFGRQNYFKYAFKNSKEIGFEKSRKKKNRIKLKHRVFVYSYYRLQRNFNKELIKAQPKLFAKNLFNAGE
jgi:hypothetical protein